VVGVSAFHLVALDEWGEAVASRLNGDGVVSAPVDAAHPESGEPSTWPQAQVHVVACAREDFDFLRAVDTFSFAWSLTWAPLVLTPRGVRLGPVVVPGVSACYHCFLRRRLQHDGEIGDTHAWWDSVALDASDSVSGWLPSDTLMARGLTRALVAKGPDGFAGTVVSYDGVSGDMNRDPVIGVHACPRCRHRPDRSDDTWAGLARQFPPAADTAGPASSEQTR
jgi:bacteriocin biosynthesis cyclodehydratase domain-containing protein